MPCFALAARRHQRSFPEDFSPIVGMILSSVCLSVRPSVYRCVLWVNDNPAAKVSEQVNRNCPLVYTIFNFQIPTPTPSLQAPGLLNHRRWLVACSE